MSGYPPFIRPGTLVRLRQVPERGRGIAADSESPERVRVRWQGNQVSAHHLSSLEGAFQDGMDVIHRSTHEGMPSHGHGRIVATRAVGDATQHLVEFAGNTEPRWLPWHLLTYHQSIEGSVRNPTAKARQDGEAVRLRNLAYALEDWTTATGGVGHLDIDPLPHQLHLAQTILRSGNLNWLIADDVGLGKTIEVGLILASLERQRRRRILLVVPAGLTKQWQEELQDKFGLDRFLIYGDQFLPETTQQWLGVDHVIVSVDRAKTEQHRANFANAGRWDLAIFDEAHWLSRKEKGWTYIKAQRYMLAEQVRGNADHVMLLSGTPHQGDPDRFQALLELLRPGREWRRRFEGLAHEPELLKSMVIRNRKADVTDIDGNFIFRGKSTKTVQVDNTPEEVSFDDQLQQYFRSGYEASSGEARTDRAIGFVMTTYRKLAASSTAAIAGALKRRLERLQGMATTSTSGETVQEDESDARFVETDEQVVGQATEFFQGELDALDRLVQEAQRLALVDSKVRAFFEDVLPGLLLENPKEKVLIFTEYRTTQDILVQGIAKRFGPESVEMIYGGQSMAERRTTVDRFNDDLQFLVSTEAGGEGLNMQGRCHILVNFDLPWNPMRLVQRVGRLYRYGQTKRVVVFNLRSAHALDQSILGGMYARLEHVAQTMGTVEAVNRDGLTEDILGQLVAAIDIAEVLETASTESEERTQERIEEAIRRAQEATKAQDELLRHAMGFDPDTTRGSLPIGLRHLQSFVWASLERLGVPVSQRLYNDMVWEIRPTETLREQFGFRTNVRIAFDRRPATKAGAILLQNDHPFLQHLFALARDVTKPGQFAFVDLPEGADGVSAVLRWADDAGDPIHTQYVHAWLEPDGHVAVNDERWAEWLATPTPALPRSDQPWRGTSRGTRLLQEAENTFQGLLKDGRGPGTHPNRAWLVSAHVAPGQPDGADV